MNQNRSIFCLLLTAHVIFSLALPAYAQESVVENSTVQQPDGTSTMVGEFGEVGIVEYPSEDSISAEPESIPDETHPQVSEPDEPIPQETEPAETVPAESIIQETIPEESTQQEAVSQTQIPQETTPLQTQLPMIDAKQIPSYFQNDYPNERYGAGTVASSGCSITCLAMAASYLTGHDYYPDELADYFGGRAENNMSRLEYGSEAMQLPYEKNTNWHTTREALKEGKIAIVLMDAKSVFTESQHFILLTGITEDGKILVKDPNKSNYDRWELRDGFENGFVESYLYTGYSGGWVYDPDAIPEEPFLYEEETVEVECRYPGVVLTQEEWDLLARVVWVEARGESFEGQQAVAEVILNRLVADGFQSSIRGVIYAEGQFRSVPHLDEAEPNQTQYDAIDQALNGPYVLPIDVYYFATYPATENVWGTIGGHIFCYAA